MKKYFSLLLLLMLSLSLVSCSNDKESVSNSENNVNEVTEIVIGTMGPYTGNLAEYGIKTRSGVELAIEEINEKGGINGKKLKLVAYDTEGDATKAVDLFNREIEQDGVKFFVGATTTSECNAVSEIAQEYKIPMITPSGTGLSITKDKSYVFRMCFTDAYQGVLMANYAKEQNLKKVAVVYNNSSDYSMNLAKSFKETAEKLGVEITSFEAYVSDDKDFSSIVTNVKSKNPEAIFLPDYYDVIANIITQFKKAGYENKFLGGDGWDGALIDFASDVEGGLFVSHYSTKDTSELATHFTKAYKDKYGQLPNSFAALAYDATYTLKEAIEKSNTLDSSVVIETFKNMEVNTVCSDNVKFNEDGDPVNKSAAVQIYKDKDVEFVTRISGNN